MTHKKPRTIALPHDGKTTLTAAIAKYFGAVEGRPGALEGAAQESLPDTRRSEHSRDPFASPDGCAAGKPPRGHGS